MKFLRLLFVVLLLSATMFAQVYKEGWGLGFGFTSPRMFGDVHSEFIDVGGYVSLQKEFNELNALRLKLDFLRFTEDPAKDRQDGILNHNVGIVTTSIGLALEYIYKFNPCAGFRLYGGAGGSVYSFTIKNSPPTADHGISNKNYLGEISFNALVGGNIVISSDLDFKAEFQYHTMSTDKFDGLTGPNGGLFGGTLDSYAAVDLGLVYYIDRGAPSKYCDEPAGITANVDYNKIQQMIDAAKQKPCVAPEIDYNRIGDMLDQKLSKIPQQGGKVEYVPSPSGEREPVFVGINFDINKYAIVPTHYSVLAHAASILLSHPNMKVEIQGNTDNKAESKNQVLSENRANSVKNYLVSKGIDASRLTCVGYGSSKPVSDNNNVEGRALNRRVDFKILEK